MCRECSGCASLRTKRGYTGLGLAFCGGLVKEAAVVDEMLTNHGYDTVSVLCKAGAVPEEEIGVRDEGKIHIGEHEAFGPPRRDPLIPLTKTAGFTIMGFVPQHKSGERR